MTIWNRCMFVQKQPVGFHVIVENYLKHLQLEAEVCAHWKQFVFCHYSCKICILNGSFGEGCEYLSQAMHHWLMIYEHPNNAWLIPVMKTMAYNLVDLALMADAKTEVIDPHLSAHKYSFAARGNLESAFAAVCRSGKRSSGLAVSNALHKLYFKLDEIQMAAVFQTRVESQLASAFDEFPMEDRAAWKYYDGLIAMDRLKFREAEEYLSYALDNSLSGPTRNLQKILFLLIPLRLLYNEFPEDRDMEAYGLWRLRSLAEAVRSANVGQLRSYLDENAIYLQSMRIWSLVQKLRHVVHRNVLVKCHRFHIQRHQPSHQMDIRIFAAGLRISGMQEATITDAVDIARHLIQKEMVCGYVASQRALLVLSKNVPFPKLRNINTEAGEIFVEAE